MSGELTEISDDQSREAAERAADMSGRPVRWRGTVVYPDYRPAFTRHPEYAAQLQINLRAQAGRGPRRRFR